METSQNQRAARWRAVSLGLFLLLIGLVIADGINREAADATKPILEGSRQKPLESAATSIRIGSFNIHSGKGSDGIRNLSRTASLLQDLDFAGLYEVRARSDLRSQNQAEALGNLAEAAWTFAPTEQQWWSDHFGNGLLFRIPTKSILRIPLVNTRGKAYRNAILSTVKLQGVSVRVIAVHIDRETDRCHQLQTIIDLFLSLQAPCVMMGDLNSTADDPLLIKLRETQGVESPLHQASSDRLPSQSIDWIFTRGLKTLSATLVENVASDHPILKAELTLPEPEKIP